MTRIEKWLLKRIVERNVRQGPTHMANMTEIFQLVKEVWAGEFTEDNEATVNATLQECLGSAKVTG